MQHLYSGKERTGVQYPEFVDTIERVSYGELNEQQFMERFEYGSRPCIIQNVADNWPGLTEWRMNRLIERFGDSKFKIGESDSGRKLKVTMKTYMEYVLYGRDDSPLYLFESSLEEHPEAKVMQNDYTKPKFFDHNLFSLLPEDEMPPHRWFLIGPKRSGSEIHQDPLGTSAWNTSVQGFKRWILIPPGHKIIKKFVRGKLLMKKGEDDEAIHYFDFIYDRLRSLEHHKEGRLPDIIECVQYPGETMFVPGAWWHAVINLDNTIAITENVCNHGNFERVWILTRKGRKRLSYKWLKELRKHHPDLFEKALQLNYRDNWVIWTPALSSKKKEFLKDHPEQGDGTSESEVSSSSSSSSSDVSSDDEKTIHVIRDGCYTPKEIKELIESPTQYKFILMVRHINRLIKDKIKAEKKEREDKEKQEKDQIGQNKPQRSRSASPNNDVQYSGGQLSETSSLRKQKHFKEDEDDYIHDLQRKNRD